MQTIKDKIKEMNNDTIDVNDLKILSLKKMATEFKQKKDLKNYIRLKTLLAYFPDMFEKNSINTIEWVLESPKDACLFFREKELIPSFLKKNYDEMRGVCVEDFFKHFKI